jgi:hypothetical protein
MSNLNLITGICGVIIVGSLAMLVYDGYRQRSKAVAGPRLKLHWWPWLLALALLLAGGGIVALNTFMEANGRIIVGYSGNGQGVNR